MSIKTCIRLVPFVRNFINSQHTCISRSSLYQINKVQPALYNKFDLRLYSTETKKDTKEIYYGVLTPQIKAVKLFSVSSSIIGIIAQPFLYSEIASTGNVPVIIAAYTFIGFFTVVTPFLLHFITKKYVTHLNYTDKTDTYTAKTVNFFCITKETKFAINDVMVPDVPGMFTTFHVKGKPLFIDPRSFEEPQHYARIMGFDKPIDFKLSQIPENEVKKD